MYLNAALPFDRTQHKRDERAVSCCVGARPFHSRDKVAQINDGVCDLSSRRVASASEASRFEHKASGVVADKS